MAAALPTKRCIHLGDKQSDRWISNWECVSVFGCNHPEHDITTLKSCETCPHKETGDKPVRVGDMPLAFVTSRGTLSQPSIENESPSQGTLRPRRNAQPVITGRPPSDAGRKAHRRWRRSIKDTRGVGERHPEESDPSVIVDRCGRPSGLAGLYYGADMFMIGGGPSLRDLDLSQLQRRGIVSLGMNNVGAYVRPNIWIHGDPPHKFHHAIWYDPGIIKLTPRAKLWNVLREKRDGKFWDVSQQVKYQPSVFGYERNTRFNPDTFLTEKTINFGHSAKHQDHRWPSTLTTFMSALRVCYYLGAFRVFLIGVDFSWQPGKDCYAFNEKRHAGAYASNNNAFTAIRTWLKALAPVLDEAGIEFYNCNPNSQLNAFPFVPYEDAIEAATSRIPEEIDTEGWYEK